MSMFNSIQRLELISGGASRVTTQELTFMKHTVCQLTTQHCALVCGEAENLNLPLMRTQAIYK